MHFILEFAGIFKVAAKQIHMEDDVPLMLNGKATYSSIGKIHKAWLKTRTGIPSGYHKNGEMLHSDGYMASMEFVSSMELLAAIPGTSFRVGLNRKEGDAEEIYEFNRRIEPKEASKLLRCMQNLRNTIEEKRYGQHS